MTRWLRHLSLGTLVALASCDTAPAGVAGTLRLPIINDPIFNPVIAPDLGSVMVNKVIFSALVRPDTALQPTPDLATSWEVAPDGLTWTFHLRPGVRWHDGAPFTSRDVKFTFDQILDLASGTRLRSDFAAVDGVDIVDSLTVRFRLGAPFAPLLTLLGYNAGILPEHLLRGQRLSDATTFNRTTPIGTGPFRLAQVTPGATVVLERNPHWYGAPPGLDRLIFKVVPDINAQVAQLRAGELDLITIEPANLGSVQHQDGITIRQVPVVQHWYVGFNTMSHLFSAPAVRRAMAFAVNREAIVAGVLKGYADLPTGTIPVALREYHDSTLHPIPFAPDSAQALLAQAGWHRDADGKLRNAAGRDFAFDLLVDKGNPTREQAALAVQQDLERIGMTVRLRTMEFAALVRDRVLPGNYEAILIWWTTPPDPDQYAFYASDQDNNHVRWRNRTADSLLLAGRRTSDPTARREIYRAFQRVERDDPPVLVLFYPREIQAATTRLRGLPALGIRDALRHSEVLSLGPGS
ncbi:MAG: peptide ABC transporter substrate-binding protein [Gemmatimonadetes bacterium]|nr:peptide ABC transporter substrate-binding protein [Gemmatimonadota bacterium]